MLAFCGTANDIAVVSMHHSPVVAVAVVVVA